MDWVALTRIFLASAMLAGAAYSDVLTRRVRNTYWLPWLAAALVLLLVDAAGGLDRGLAMRLAVAGASITGFYAMWWLGLLFGGADAKALMVMALLVPMGVSDAPWQTTGTLDAFVNGTFLTLAVPLVIGVWNLLRGRFAGAATFLAVQMPLAEARSRFVWPMERASAGETGDVVVRRKLWQSRGEDLDGVYDELESAGVSVVWASPKLPFLVPLLAGWLVAVFWGNILLAAIARFLVL